MLCVMYTKRMFVERSVYYATHHLNMQSVTMLVEDLVMVICIVDISSTSNLFLTVPGDTSTTTDTCAPREMVAFCIIFNKQKYDISFALDDSVESLKQEIEKLTGKACLHFTCCSQLQTVLLHLQHSFILSPILFN